MCACDFTFTCGRCKGTSHDDRYPDLPDAREDDLRRANGLLASGDTSEVEA
jgi:hypothetical protein